MQPRRALSGYKTKRQLAIEAIMDAILHGKYSPGTRLRQDRISTELGLSTTLVREAMAELQAQGLLVHESHWGTRVADLSLADLEELYPLRGLLESYAARLAVANLSDENVQHLAQLRARMEKALQMQNLAGLRDADSAFHMTIYGAEQNARLANLIHQLWGSFPRHMLWLIPGRATEG